MTSAWPALGVSMAKGGAQGALGGESVTVRAAAQAAVQPSQREGLRSVSVTRPSGDMDQAEWGFQVSPGGIKSFLASLA